MGKNIYQGHRIRMRDNFIEEGCYPDLTTLEVLEMILFYAIPRKNTNEIAHRLLNVFGSLTAVCNASYNDLIKVEGVSKNAAVLIKLMPASFHAHRSEMASKKKSFASVEDVGQYLLDRYSGVVEEQFSILSLSSSGRIIAFDRVACGDISSVGVSIRKVIEILIRTSATTVILAHNHPGGVALPSESDLSVTKSISQALKPLGIHILDHIILVEDDFVSLRQTEQFKTLF